MNRHEQRIIAMKSIYQHLLLDKDIRKCVYECMEGCNEIDGYLYSLTIGTAENKEKSDYQIVLSRYLYDIEGCVYFNENDSFL